MANYGYLQKESGIDLPGFKHHLVMRGLDPWDVDLTPKVQTSRGTSSQTGSGTRKGTSLFAPFRNLGEFYHSGTDARVVWFALLESRDSS